MNDSPAIEAIELTKIYGSGNTEVVAMRNASRMGLMESELPFATDPFELWQVWHERAHHDKAHRWLREQLRTIAVSLAA